jgi:hypothetical protein
MARLKNTGLFTVLEFSLLREGDGTEPVFWRQAHLFNFLLISQTLLDKNWGRFFPRWRTLVRICIFILTLLPLVIERFLASSDKSYKVFNDMITNLIAANKEDGRIYSVFILSSIFPSAVSS